ncbi:MAG: hypothetical protein IT427_18265, partial [Pirellulales bacterium]|nr:hypothetical protein [Pirellulales bacterium]
MKNYLFALLSTALTTLCWGIYGPLLSWGGADMGGSHWLPFICLGIAYFLIAVIAPAALLRVKSEPGGWTAGGVAWSFFAGVAGAIGALGVILALSNGGKPL